MALQKFFEIALGQCLSCRSSHTFAQQQAFDITVNNVGLYPYGFQNGVVQEVLQAGIAIDIDDGVNLIAGHCIPPQRCPRRD